MTMLQLNRGQQDALEALALDRDRVRLAAALSSAFPDVAQRLGDRLPALIDLGRERGAFHGLSHGLAVARYLGCWMMLGAEFENQPAYPWARPLLDSAFGEGAKIFQLCRGAREALRSGDPSSAAAFDAALVSLDDALATMGALGSLAPRQFLRLGEPCDVEALEISLPDARWRHDYRLLNQQWQRVPAAPAPERLRIAVTDPMSLPEQINWLVPGASHDVKLRVRVAAAHKCPLHPRISHACQQDMREWRGELAQDLATVLPAAAPLPPEIAGESGPVLSLIDVTSCGLRSSGAPMGDLRCRVAVYPAEQHLLAWRRDGVGELSLPGDAVAATAPRARLERDGVALDAGGWERALAELDVRLHAGLGRLLNAWERTAGVGEPALHARRAAMSGRVAQTWGYADSPAGPASAPEMRLEVMADLMLWELDLSLEGRFSLGGTQSRLTLRCQGKEALQLHWQRTDGDAELGSAIAPLSREFRHPWTLAVQPLAGDSPLLLNATAPARGMLVGRCGLRPHPMGNGLQWFARVDVEPVVADFVVTDPSLGSQSLSRPLLPAFNLLDWSAF